MHSFSYNNKLNTYSRNRRQQQTPAEILLWSKLRNRQFLRLKFKRQFPFENYILDFYCLEKMLCIEIDGASHDENKFEYDINRHRFLESKGITVMRFTEYEVSNNLNSVLQSLELKFEEL